MKVISPTIKAKVLSLRKEGLSYNEIRQHVSVAKSTLSLWLKNVPLSSAHQKRLYTKQIQILSLGSQSQRERRAREVKTIIEQAKHEITVPISEEAFRLMGAALYWAEGSKGKMCQLTNSDPALILFFVRWIAAFYLLPPHDLYARLNIYPQQNEKKIKAFWSELTGIPLHHFGKSFVKPFSTGYKKNNLYYGTIKIEVPKSVNFKYRIFGWIQGVLHDTQKDIEIVQRKWQSLMDVKRAVNLQPNTTSPHNSTGRVTAS